MKYDSSYSILVDIIKNNGGQRTEFCGIYDTTLYLADLLGVDVNIDYDSVYSIALGILGHFGGDTSIKYDSVYSVVKAIAEANNIDVTGADSAYSELLPMVDADSGWQGLKFKALQNSTILYTPSTVSTAEYSDDNGETWKTFDNVTVTLNEGDEIYVRGNISGNQSLSDYAKFTMSGSIEGNGNVNSLISNNFTGIDTIPYDYCFTGLFNGCGALVKAPQLPATTLTKECYVGMFQSTGISDIPTLPATTLGYRCYAMMFYHCTGLIRLTKVLPATTLAEDCYDYMFAQCTNLTHVGDILPATTLAKQCYKQMFYLSNNLETAPKLPGLILQEECYRQMFAYCMKLTSLTVYATDISATDCLKGWTTYINTTGDFYNLGGATYEVGANGIPTNWTEHTSL